MNNIITITESNYRSYKIDYINVSPMQNNLLSATTLLSSNEKVIGHRSLSQRQSLTFTIMSALSSSVFSSMRMYLDDTFTLTADLETFFDFKELINL
jgi:hypothetical protein